MQGKILVMDMHTNIYQFQLCPNVIEPHINFFYFLKICFFNFYQFFCIFLKGSLIMKSAEHCRLLQCIGILTV